MSLLSIFLLLEELAAEINIDYKNYPTVLAAMGDSFDNPLSLMSSPLRCYTLWKCYAKEGDGQNKPKAEIFKRQYDMYIKAIMQYYSLEKGLK